MRYLLLGFLVIFSTHVKGNNITMSLGVGEIITIDSSIKFGDFIFDFGFGFSGDMIDEDYTNIITHNTATNFFKDSKLDIKTSKTIIRFGGSGILHKDNNLIMGSGLSFLSCRSFQGYKDKQEILGHNGVYYIETDCDDISKFLGGVGVYGKIGFNPKEYKHLYIGTILDSNIGISLLIGISF